MVQQFDDYLGFAGIMPPTVLFGVIMFSIVMGFTPGPNNIMLASSGANYGVRATTPHIMGVSFGFPFMLALVGCGLASIFTALPILSVAMKAVSIVYLIWLAWHIARAGAVSMSAGGRPMTFFQAAAFQWINPKAWMIAIGVVTTYTTGTGLVLVWQVLIIVSVGLLVSLGSSTSWAFFGQMVGGLLSSTRRRLVFNYSMAALLVLSIVPVLIER